MEGRIEDADLIDLLSVPSSSPLPPTRAYPNVDFYSEKVGEVQGEQRTTISTSSTTHFPKVFDRFDDSSSSDDDFFSAGTSGGAAETGLVQKRLDYMIQFLDRKLSVSEDEEAQRGSSLPEFVASGGGDGIFKLPIRAAAHPSRPPSLELRPHPLRETQIGCFLRTIGSSCAAADDDNNSQLWAGSECGVRFWKVSDIYYGRSFSRSGDEEAAIFHESVRTPPTLCLIKDPANGVVWCGHMDGRIRCWKIDNPSSLDGNEIPFKECLSWQAHRDPVLSIAITSYGDIWSGSEGGVIRIWPWEAIEKSLSLTKEERHMASLLVERSYIDLRSQVTVNGACYSIFSADIKYLLSDHCGAKVWSAGYLSFALWDARTRELLKVFNLDGQIDNMPGLLQDTTAVEDEMRLKFVSGGALKPKENSQYSMSFFQRSRNAIKGAADAVRRVAVKGAFGDDYRRTESLITTVDGNIWSGCANGLLVQWDGNGNRLQDFQYNSSAVHCLCTFGSRIWVGYASGTVQVLDLNGNLLGGWLAHNSPVIDMAVWGGYIFTLANHGGIRGWMSKSPGALDSIIRSELAGKEFLYTKLENLKILAGTWNVGQGRATYDSLISWIGSAAADVGIVVVGLQEVEMGAGFLAMSAARETVGLEGSSVGQWWIDMIGKTLDEGSTFVRVGSRQLAGLLITVWVRNNIRSHVGDVDVAAVPCGLGRAIGNKGAVGLRMRVYGRIMCFVNCHFAAHVEAVSRRNDDFDHVYRTMTFTRPSNPLNTAAAGISSSIQMVRGANGMEGVPELGEADMIVFVGDFNYRLDGISYDEARDFISQRSFDWLRERDQLQAEMKAGNVFQGMREAVIGFPPTYKFERHQDGLAGYDSGEKKRTPAWCDRILYRDSRSASISSCSLDCPVVASVLQYEACMDVTDSDHKPVRCIFSVEIARVDESVRRQEFGEIIGCNEKVKSILEELSKVPETIVSTNNIILQNQDTSILRITNKGGVRDRRAAHFEIICEGQSTIKEGGQEASSSDHCPRAAFGFPRWLEVSPASGIIEAGHIAEISVHHYEHETVGEYVDGVPQNWWCEDARDKEVILVVKVSGGGGGPTTAESTKSHRVRVRHTKTIIINNDNSNGMMGGYLKKLNKSQMPNNNSNDNTSSNNNSVLHRSDFQPFSCSSDVVHHLRNLHSP